MVYPSASCCSYCGRPDSPRYLDDKESDLFLPCYIWLNAAFECRLGCTVLSHQQNEQRDVGTSRSSIRKYYYIDYPIFVNYIKWGIAELRAQVDSHSRDVSETMKRVLGLSPLLIVQRRFLYSNTPARLVDVLVHCMTTKRNDSGNSRSGLRVQHLQKDMAIHRD